VRGVTAPPTGLTDDQRATVQRRTLRTLVLGQVIGSAALTSALTVGGLIAEEMLGSDTLAGVAAASLTVGGAVGAAVLARHMSRHGRRPGLRAGYLLGALGAVVAVAGAEAGWLPLFLVGLFLYGHGQAANLLARYAAADLAAVDERARAISTLVFASTFGAVAGPLLVGLGKRLGEAVGIDDLSGPYLLSCALFLLAAGYTTLFLRPDPLVVAGGVRAAGAAREPVHLRGALAVILASPGARLALGSMAVSQGVMVAVMTMTPLHMKGHGHSVELIGLVLAVHIAGMYAFAPLVGWGNDRIGREPMIAFGAAVLVAANVVAALAGRAPGLLFVGLFLLGVGWSVGLVSGSALLSDSVQEPVRVQVQGTADLLMSMTGAVAGFGSGFVKQGLGYHVLADLGAVAAAALLGAALLRRTPRPGRRRPEVAPGRLQV
jgi:MFS family permease